MPGHIYPTDALN